MAGDAQLRHLAQLGLQFTEVSAALTSFDGDGLDPDLVVKLAARALPHTHHCALTVLRSGRFPHTISVTDPLPRLVDEIQFSTREGPCLDESTGHAVTLSGGLGADPRWPAFGPRCVAETGVQSMLAVRLALVGGDHASLGFYSRKPDAFGELDVGVASIFAPFAALAVEQVLRRRDAADFKSALSSSRQIGAAIGIIMAHDLVTSEDAFERLREASQHLNRKLRDIAAEVEQTGEVPV
ncbi:MAG: GAF and ANTAR domain-containing protein [Intrasporangium sp.]|uniref:GAF and ANTAR domain-containing protein n=1 Tax=Intrasporangium sp. TaxID=1925024 RepID=UPI00264830BD|nr:GAF and ANTAR domain-containing protein [Intrasporangium sp.]MDN5796512.1 GAF and ANTAR domain-containing protein [Intrasporangium sp.]